ncbi:Hypothetical protein LUCI_5019 [Lucifera butyrica]|uniref:Uncharacterized protein n=1 Tax=Lucifera butyrica TaxID=1351585 RepID=A0A498RE06_9FIRM|nr:Hypothetical protein LUCI_5019 [Lucifera butyrica]
MEGIWPILEKYGLVADESIVAVYLEKEQTS